MQQQNNTHDLRKTPKNIERPQNIEGSFGNGAPEMLETASDLMDLAIAQYHENEEIESIVAHILGEPPIDYSFPTVTVNGITLARLRV